MIRQMERADRFRILKGKVLFITVIITLLFVALQVFSSNTSPVMVSFGDSPINGFEAIAKQQQTIGVTGRESPFIIMGNSDVLAYILLAVFSVVVVTDFTTGAIKNTISRGMKRTDIYLSKLLLCCKITTIYYFGMLLISTLASTILNGFGGALSTQYVLTFLRCSGLQWLLLMGMTSVGVALAFIFRGGAFSGIYIGFFLAPIMCIMLLAEFYPSAQKLLKIDFTMNLRMMASIQGLVLSDIIRAVAIGLVYLVGGTALGMTVFKRAEIK